MSTRKTTGLLAIVGAAAMASSAHAAVSRTIIEMTLSATVEGETYTRTLEWTADTSEWKDKGSWAVPVPTGGQVIYALDQAGNIVLHNGEAVVLGTLNNANFAYITDPQVALNFSVQAGPFGSNFVISSAVLAFPDPNQNSGFASAGITVTGNGNGASLTETNPNGIYTAMFNGTNVFTNLHNLAPAGALTAPANGSATYNDQFGFAPIIPDANNISSEFRFGLTAGDQASGTSVFIVVPAPASAALLGLSGLIVARRRR